MGHAGFFRLPGNRNASERARIKIGPLRMGLEKRDNTAPRETSLIVPRVEIRTSLKTPFFTYTKETVYNSVTIVDTPVRRFAREHGGRLQKTIFPQKPKAASRKSLACKKPGCRESLRC